MSDGWIVDVLINLGETTLGNSRLCKEFLVARWVVYWRLARRSGRLVEHVCQATVELVSALPLPA